MPRPISIPDELAELVRSLRSLWAIEVLLLLHHEPERSWSIDDLVRELRSNVQLVGDVLTLLEQVGAVARQADGTYRYRAATPELAALVDDLDRLHAERPLALARLLHGTPDDKLRAFSDAFKLKKD